MIILQYKDNVLADLSSSISAEIGNDALIVGEKGIIKVERFWMLVLRGFMITNTNAWIHLMSPSERMDMI